MGDRGKYLVEKIGVQSLSAGWLLVAHHLDHIGSLFKGLQHMRDFLRRVLEVAVHGDDGVAGDRVQAGLESRLMPEVPGQAKVAHGQALITEAVQDFNGVIRAAVVDKKHLYVPRWQC